MTDAVKTNKAAIQRIEAAKKRTDKPWQVGVLNQRIFALVGDIRGRRQGTIEPGQVTPASRLAHQIVSVRRRAVGA